MSRRAAYAATLVLSLACSGPVDLPSYASGDTTDELAFVPRGLASTELSGEGGLTLIAFTLQQRGTELELLVAARNDGTTPACDAGVLTHFIDRGGRLVATVGSSLHGGQLYRLDGGTGPSISCLRPGQVAMAASTSVPQSVVLDQLGYLQHAFPAFTLDGIVPLERGITLTASASPSTQTYTGLLRNGLDVPVDTAKVVIFPVNRAGRPLGVATGDAASVLQPGEIWPFETTRVDSLGASHVAYSAVSFIP